MLRKRLRKTDKPCCLVYGGSFDPVHVGHIILPMQVLRLYPKIFTKLIFVPSGTPPHKSRKLTDQEHRLEMLRLALFGNDVSPLATKEPKKEVIMDGEPALFSPSDIREAFRKDFTAIAKEIFVIEDYEAKNSSNPNYTCQTLEYLALEYPNYNLALLFGSDLAKDFFIVWKNPNRIIELAEPLVMTRPGYKLNGWKFSSVEVEPLDISSTFREKLQQQEYDDDLVRECIHPDVLEYIKKHRLYT